ncbi:MAG: zinc-binding dehydrogenase [Planctomycetes bacterium]|nr:zinc-binding dehydrogenase [Planctomycetota bacterium]
MKAVVKTAPGDGHMELLDIPEPEATGDLVKIKIAYHGICGTDLHAARGTYASTRPPVVLGHEFSGIVVDTGPDVTRFRPGDRVTSESTFRTCGACPSCASRDYNLCSNRVGLGTNQNGSMAQYLVSREESVHRLPDNVGLLAACLTEPLACGVHAGIEKGNIREGEVVCIFGAGAIGLMLSQVALARGGTVILAGLSNDAERFAIARDFGVHRTVDQQTEDLSLVVKEMTSGWGVDTAFECSGAVRAANAAFDLVKKKGKVIQMGVFDKEMETIWTDRILHKEIEYIGSRSQKPTSWVTAIELLAAGTVHPEMIVHEVVPLERWRDAFDAAMRGEGAKGVICCNPDLQEQ